MPFCANGKLHDAGVGIARIRCEVEAEFLTHRKHRGVFTQHLPFDGLEPFGVGIFDHHLHEQIAETASLEIGADEDGVFRALV
jgi:hypothetical protein